MNSIRNRCLVLAVLVLGCVAVERCSKGPRPGTPEYMTILEQVDKEVDAHLANDLRKGTLGFCHVFWAEKKRILKVKYGIDWKTPEEENPDSCFD